MTIADLFAKNSKIAESFPKYIIREGQIKMAEAISNAIANRNALVAEAGTGIGKTLAYLVPSISSGGKVIISTGTKALQDQLYLRDLPKVVQSLLIPVTTALLKGRANYVCHYHLGRALNNQILMKEKWFTDLREISNFAITSKTGDKADCINVAENSNAWKYAISTRDNCLSSKCQNFDECFVNKARKNAFAADVLVVNHHLFFADIAIKEKKGLDLLPDTHIVIFDEAHQVKDTASLFFSDSISTGQLRELARDARMELMNYCADMPEIHKFADFIDYRSVDLIAALHKQPEKVNQNDLLANPKIKYAFDQLINSLKTLLDNLKLVTERSLDLQKIYERCLYAKAVISLWLNPLLPDNQELANIDHTPEQIEASLINHLNNATSETTYIHWLEKKENYARVIRTPLSIAESMQRQYNLKPRSWIFCSATIAVGDDFNLVKNDLGLNKIDRGCEQIAISSPFDYHKNSRLYITKNLPSPTQPEYFAQMIKTIVPLINNCCGGIFILCTSYRSVTQFSKILPAKINKRKILIQNDMTNHQLLSEFRNHGDAVLIGTMTFWEGVDFQGPILSMVIIDKLPFAPPDDPIQKVLNQEMKKNGGNPFFDLQLPQAALLLKQGAGRLIRSENDQGVLVICDSRLRTKGYGSRLIKAIPPMTQVDDQAQVIEFLKTMK